jgi:Protein of unknown function (DUF1153)
MSALRHVPIHHRCKIAEMATLLAELAKDDPVSEPTDSSEALLETENRIADGIFCRAAHLVEAASPKFFRAFKMECDLPCNQGPSDHNRLDDIFGPMPELPSPSTQRWTTRRKAAVIEAVHGGWVPIEEVCRLYMISVDEFIAWERDIDQFGIQGLRTTRYQIYRHREPRRTRRGV